MLGHIKNILKKKETLLQKKEPLFFDVNEFLKHRHPLLAGSIMPLRHIHGVLTVSAASSVAVQEFFLVKNDLLLYLRDRNHAVRDITTRLHV